MKRRHGVVAAVLAGWLGLGWGGWVWYTTPTPPSIALDELDDDVRTAIAAALDDVRRSPRSAVAWGDLSLHLLANGYYDQALTCLVQTEKLDPGDARWPYWQGLVLLRSSPRGIDRLRHAYTLAELPEPRADIAFRLALALIEDGQIDEAAERLCELAAVEPGGPRVRYAQGLLAVARDDRAGAREHLKTLVDHPNARQGVSALLATLTEGDEAAEHRQRAARLPPDPPWLTSFETQMDLYRVDNTGPLAQHFALEREGSHAEALSVLQELAANAPDHAVCYRLGMKLLHLDRLDEAEQRFRQALTFSPDHVKSHLFLGVVLLGRGEKLQKEAGSRDAAQELFRQALGSIDKALSVQRDVASAHVFRGQALKRLGRTEESLGAFREAVTLGPENAGSHLVLGEALAEAGQLAEALKHLENAVAVADPKDPRPRQALAKWQAKAKANK